MATRKKKAEENEEKRTGDEVREAALAALRVVAALDDVLRAEHWRLSVVAQHSEARLEHSGRGERVAAPAAACTNTTRMRMHFLCPYKRLKSSALGSAADEREHLNTRPIAVRVLIIRARARVLVLELVRDPA